MTHLTPNQIAKSRGIGVMKVLGWIESGELKAVNYATKRGGLPRWKIAPESLAEFEKLRASAAPAKTTAKAKAKTTKQYV
jgi:hypothetical protein